MAHEPGTAGKLILVGGHESNFGKDLGYLSSLLPDATIAATGRSLQAAVSRALASGPGPVIVLPMTFGRNPVLVADTAKTLKWLAAGDGKGRLALSVSFGSGDHLIAWLRIAATNIKNSNDDSALVLMVAKSNPFDDAELYRIAHLVRTHGTGSEVEVACVATDDEVSESVDRLRKLGHPHVVVVPAGFSCFSTASFGEGALAAAEYYGPLMSAQAIVRVINDRFNDALHELSHGSDGISAGLTADHGHGYAHSHAFESGAGNDLSHEHCRGHTHSHAQ